MRSFRWLHLSDFHVGMGGHSWHWPNVREKIHEDIDILHDHCGPWDIVFFTGDLTQCGNNDEFDRCEQALLGLFERLHALGSEPLFVVVPGNHDLIRPDPKDPAVRLLRQWDQAHDIRKEFWGDPASAYRQLVDASFANYTAWRQSSKLPRPSIMAHGPIPGDVAATVEKKGLRIGILGLNSAFLQLTGEDYNGRLAVGLPQFHETCGGDGQQWAAAHDLCFLLGHHPLDWLSPETRNVVQGDIYPPGRFAAYLCGHMHSGRSETRAVCGAQPWRYLQAPSLFGLENWGLQNEHRRYGYLAGRIDLDKDRCYIRIWPRTGWRSDDGVLRIAPDYQNFDLDRNSQGTRPEEFGPRLSRGGEDQSLLDGPPKQLFGELRSECRDAEHEALCRLFTPYRKLQRVRIEQRRQVAPKDPQKNLLGFYIPARGSREPPARKSSEDKSVGRLWDQIVPALVECKPCIVLADFGMGKTWFLEHLIYWLSGDDVYPRWIPLTSQLRTFKPGHTSMRGGNIFGLPRVPSIFEQLRWSCWVDAIGGTAAEEHRQSLLQLYESGRFLFLLDGLDEMAIKTRFEIDQVISDIGSIAASAHRSPLVITCRRNLFQDSAQERSLQDRGFEVFHLWPWSTQDILDYLSKAHHLGLFDEKPDAALEQLCRVYDLRDLAGRALLSAMLVDQWNEIIPRATPSSEPPDLISLYERHIEKALVNWQSQKTLLQLQKHEMIRYMEELAYLMFRLDSLDIRPEELDQYFEKEAGILKAGRYSDIAQSLVRDIKVNSLLVREDDNYAFCHASIWEFFVARKLIRSLEDGRFGKDPLAEPGRSAQYQSILNNFLMPILKQRKQLHLIDAYLKQSNV